MIKIFCVNCRTDKTLNEFYTKEEFNTNVHICKECILYLRKYKLKYYKKYPRRR